jgi:hypothetical protein
VQADYSVVAYTATARVGWRVDPVIALAPVLTRIVRATQEAVAKELAEAGLRADSEIDILPIYCTVRIALGKQTNQLAVENAAAAAAQLAVERYLDAITAPIAAQ